MLSTYTDFQGHTTTLSYDNDGFVSSIKDANSHITNIKRLNQGFPTGVIETITHPGGSTIQYFYTDATGAYLDHMIDERDKQTTYKRNAPPAMTTYEIDYPDGGVEKYTYNTLGQVATHTSPANTSTGTTGGKETFTYDTAGSGLLITYTPPSGTGGATQYGYDINDHLQTITDPRGNVTTLYYNEIGQVTVEVHDDSDNSQIDYSYNADGTLQQVNTQLNATTWATTSYVYDDYKRITSATNPTDDTTYFYYDVVGATTEGLAHTDANVTRLVLPSGKVTQTLYDENLRKGLA